MKPLRVILASALAPVAGLALPVAAALWEASQPAQLVNGVPDDAPHIALALFAPLLGPLYVALFVLALALGPALRDLGCKTAIRFSTACETLAALLAVLIGAALAEPTRYGGLDTFYSIAFVLLVLVAYSVPSSLAWWYLQRQ